jgi:hypothetical protein
MRSFHFVLAASIVATGCQTAGSRGANSTGQPSAPDTTVRGIVQTLGAVPSAQVVLRSSNSGSVAVTGALLGEIATLEGVEVSVTGPAIANNPPSPPRAVDARSYDIVAVGGTPARAGVLTRRGETMWLAGARDTVELQSPTPPNLAVMIGSRVYLVGNVINGKLRVEAYGAVGKR